MPPPPRPASPPPPGPRGPARPRPQVRPARAAGRLAAECHRGHDQPAAPAQAQAGDAQPGQVSGHPHPPKPVDNRASDASTRAPWVSETTRSATQTNFRQKNQVTPTNLPIRVDLVSASPVAALWRLHPYLRPYRYRLTFFLLAAILST